jgi:hypothetical protein
VPCRKLASFQVSLKEAAAPLFLWPFDTAGSPAALGQAVTQTATGTWHYRRVERSPVIVAATAVKLGRVAGSRGVESAAARWRIWLPVLRYFWDMPSSRAKAQQPAHPKKILISAVGLEMLSDRILTNTNSDVTIYHILFKIQIEIRILSITNIKRIFRIRIRIRLLIQFIE